MHERRVVALDEVRLVANKPIYRRTASYGHFGRAPEKDGGFSWERIDLADTIRKAMD